MQPLTPLQKKIIYKATHRSSREADILFGEFIKKNIHIFSLKDLSLLEGVVEYEDSFIIQMINKPEMNQDINLKNLFQKWSEESLSEN